MTTIGIRDLMVLPRRNPLGRVLVVDNEPHVGSMLRDVLTDLGYAVKHAPGDTAGR